MCLLTAANQISKSSTLIRKTIHWATCKALWPKLWRRPPKVFFYFYPSYEVATVEVENKWIPEFLPRGPFKDDPVYGWRIEYQKKMVHSIHFNSGVTVYFKSYSQGENTLQSTSVDLLVADEEMPEHLYAELTFRLAATDGYFISAFTATLNQDMWRRAMEGTGDTELFPDAFKQTISMYDCLVYEDGTPSPWTEKRIKEQEAKCTSQTEIDRRIHGKFVTEHGRTFAAFNSTLHFIPPKPTPHDWRVYSGVDLGSGGSNHPAAIVFLAVSPTGNMGWVVDGWRGDGQVTTAGDVLDKYRELAKKHRIAVQAYDPHSKDFGTIAERAGMSFMKADKRHDYGEDIINTLFKNKALFLFDTPELRKLGSELTSLQKSTPKTKAKDDFCDALRYAAATQVPWDWELLHKDLSEEPKDADHVPEWTPAERAAYEMRRRRGEEEPHEKDGWQELHEEIDEWNEAYYA